MSPLIGTVVTISAIKTILTRVNDIFYVLTRERSPDLVFVQHFHDWPSTTAGTVWPMWWALSLQSERVTLEELRNESNWNTSESVHLKLTKKESVYLLKHCQRHNGPGSGMLLLELSAVTELSLLTAFHNTNFNIGNFWAGIFINQSHFNQVY